MSGEATEPQTPTVVDLSDALAEAGDGVHWTLQPAGDLNINLVKLDAGHRVDEHVNRDVDVAVVVVAGEGSIHIDGARALLRPHVVAHVPRGASRRIEAGPAGLGYLTVHRRRAFGLGPKPVRPGGR